MTYDILTIGGIMRDIIFLTKDGLVINNAKDPLRQKLIGFELGAKIYVKKVYFESGGGANNTAVGFSKLGLKTAIICRVGQDKEGSQLIKELKKQKISTRLIQVDKKISTGLSFVLSLKHRKRAHTIFAYRGANDYLNFNISHAELNHIKWFYISSLSSSNWLNILSKIFLYSKKGIKIAWNPSTVQLKAGFKKLTRYLKQTQVLILNDDEAKELVLSEKKAKSLSIKYLLKQISLMGPKIIVITVGENGSFAYDGKNFYFQKPAPAKVVNTTGAGDSFSAAFISSLFYFPNNIKKALKWGAINSSSVIDKIGAQKGLLNKNGINKLSKYV